MKFLQRDWSDPEKWAMGVVSALLIAAVIGSFSYKSSTVKLLIASYIDSYGRCIDRELFIINETDEDALDIAISFDVDYFTRLGRVAIEYGDEQEQLITSVTKTLLKRRPFVPVNHQIDYENSKFVIPRLRPQEYLHIYYGGENILDSNAAEKRRELLEKGAREVMDKPRVQSAVRKDGAIAIKHVIECGS